MPIPIRRPPGATPETAMPVPSPLGVPGAAASNLMTMLPAISEAIKWLTGMERQESAEMPLPKLPDLLNRIAGGMGYTPQAPTTGPTLRDVGTPELGPLMTLGSILGVLMSTKDRQWFKGSQVVDEHGKPRRVFHGAGRSDRVTDWKADRATSGPMPFFTDDPSVASGYATNKADTSLFNEDVWGYDTQVTIDVPGRGRIPISQAWRYLPHDVKQRLRRNLPHVIGSGDDPWDYSRGFAVDPNQFGVGDKGHWDQVIREQSGDVLNAARDVWLDSGTLYDDERKFTDVLEAAGLPKGWAEFNDPYENRGGVFPVVLKITRPLETAHIPPNVIADLAEMAQIKAEAGFQQTRGADFWDKSSRDPVDWIRTLQDDQQKGTSLAWTSIPDWVVEVLKQHGYDGVKDTGGKHGGISHTVWVPFDPEQIRTAYYQNDETKDK